MSAGNAAAALAYGAAIHGCKATIVMPAQAVPSKIAATRDYGGEVVLTEEDLMGVVGELQRSRGLTLVHPYDDLRIMAGHGTIGIELLEDLPDIDAVIVPVGGGGLIGGIATAVKALRPDTMVFGVEPLAADCMTRALAAGRPVPIGHPGTVADGLAAPFAGEHTLRHVERFVDGVLRVEDATIVEALRLLITRCKLAAEPSGAAALAALLIDPPELRSLKRVVCLVSGGNVDLAALAELLRG
jgi:threonine dehydratase